MIRSEGSKVEEKDRYGGKSSRKPKEKEETDLRIKIGRKYYLKCN